MMDVCVCNPCVRQIKVALEVDGPHHFAQDGHETGATLLKQRQLRATGWRPLSVPYLQWYAMQHNQNKENAYLQEKLAKATAAPLPGPPAEAAPSSLPTFSNHHVASAYMSIVPNLGGPPARMAAPIVPFGGAAGGTSLPSSQRMAAPVRGPFEDASRDPRLRR